MLYPREDQPMIIVPKYFFQCIFHSCEHLKYSSGYIYILMRLVQVTFKTKYKELLNNMIFHLSDISFLVSAYSNIFVIIHCSSFQHRNLYTQYGIHLVYPLDNFWCYLSNHLHSIGKGTRRTGLHWIK